MPCGPEAITSIRSTGARNLTADGARWGIRVLRRPVANSSRSKSYQAKSLRNKRVSADPLDRVEEKSVGFCRVAPDTRVTACRSGLPMLAPGSCGVPRTKRMTRIAWARPYLADEQRRRARRGECRGDQRPNAHTASHLDFAYFIENGPDIRLRRFRFNAPKTRRLGTLPSPNASLTLASAARFRQLRSPAPDPLLCRNSTTRRTNESPAPVSGWTAFCAYTRRPPRNTRPPRGLDSPRRAPPHQSVSPSPSSGSALGARSHAAWRRSKGRSSRPAPVCETSIATARSSAPASDCRD